MTGSAPSGDGRCFQDTYVYIGVIGLGVWGKGWLAIAPDGRLADDGKRPYRRWPLYIEGSLVKGRGSGGREG